MKKQGTLLDYLEKPKKVKDRKMPDGIELKPKQSWCPYCSAPIILVKNNYLGVKECPICGISEKDYWMKKVNGIRE